MPARLIAVVCALALFAGAVLAQRQANQIRVQAEGDEILYLPNQQILNHFTGGLNNIVADLLWLRCIQYVATESKGDRNFTWLQQMLDTVVQLDPYFGDAYRYGGMFLAALRADDDAGIDLLERGFIANPDNHQIPYELAMIFLLNRKEEPGAKERATHYLSMAAAIDGAPGFVRDLASKLQDKHDLDGLEREMWTRMSESGDKLLRDLAARKLDILELREVTDKLNEEAVAFNQRHGRFPESLAELEAADLIPPLGTGPLGGRFFMGEDGVIRNTTLLDEDKQDRLKTLRNRIKAFENAHGRPPDSLEELVERGEIGRLPDHPYSGQRWRYDPATGTVE